MWEMAAAFVQMRELHWLVLGLAVAGFVFKVFQSTESLLMGDVYGDELDG